MKHKSGQLIEAIHREDLAGVKRLLKAGVSPNDPSDGQLPLVQACQYGLTAIAECLIHSGADVDKQDDVFHHNALSVSCEQGHAELVELLLRVGANPNKLRQGACSPLADAGSGDDEGRAEIVRLLLDAGANPKQVFHSEKGVAVSDVLMAHCASGSVKMVKLLLDAGADVNNTLFFGTPLTAAAENNRADIVKALLQRGADPCIRLANDIRLQELAGKNASEIAAVKGYKKVASLIDRFANR